MASLWHPITILLLTAISGAFCVAGVRRITGELRRILLWSVGSIALALLSPVLAIARELTGDARLLFYERLVLLVALFLFASIVPHFRTYVCVRCSVGESHGP
jgi:hypothetical protein